MKLLLIMIGSVNMNNLSLLITIAGKDKEKKYLNILNSNKVKFQALTYGTGTASSSLLEYFGLNELSRVLIFAVMPRIKAKHVLKDMDAKIQMQLPGNGISFTIPLSSSTKYMQDSYREKMEDIEMDSLNKHLIVTIANEGYAEIIMNAAKKVGAQGGTTINGRGLETEKIIKFLGVSIAPEKDIVLILTDDNDKNNIMNEIVSTCGLQTPGAGICFSLPVDYAMGLKNN